MYRMYLIIEGRDYEIPVLPDTFPVKSPGKNEVIEIVKLGDINRLRQKGLKEISWSSFFPANVEPYVTGQVVYEPMDYIKAIQTARDLEKPIRFLLLGADLDVNTLFGIDDLSYEERAGEVGDIYYTLKLKEWKHYAAKTVTLPTAQTVKKAVVSAPKRPGAPPPKKTHTVKKGDSLWAISKAAYNDGGKYPQVYSTNKPIIDNGNKGTGYSKYTIHPGQVFVL